MIGMTYHAQRCQQWGGRLIKNLAPADMEKIRRDPALRVVGDGELGDGRLVFESSARDAFHATESLHQVNRNVRFVDEPLKVNHFLDAHLIGGARVVNDGVISPDA